MKKNGKGEKEYSQKNDSKAKPFLKWAGGKGQLLDKFNDFYPEELKSNQIHHYYEPFVGGGAVFFYIAQQFNIKSAYLFDINEELILSYKVVQRDVSKLIETLEKLSKGYLKLTLEKRSEFYYKIREKFNKERHTFDYNKYSTAWIKRTAQIIFLNRTCFNGLFRFNSSGEFNVPVGRYKNPRILNEQNLQLVSELLSNAEIKKADFREIIKSIQPFSFVYFDPPYRPLNRTSGFTAYSKEKFTDEEQKQLAGLFKELDKKNIKLMLSNSDPKNSNPDDNFFDELYKDFEIFRIPAKRMINSDASKRHAVQEIIVTNYSVSK